VFKSPSIDRQLCLRIVAAVLPRKCQCSSPNYVTNTPFHVVLFTDLCIVRRYIDLISGIKEGSVFYIYIDLQNSVYRASGKYFFKRFCF
jgi:hypothetical protein